MNEAIWGTMKRELQVDNFFISHSLSALGCFPIFAGFHCRDYTDLYDSSSFKNSRMQAYRYVGTLCCISLTLDALISFYRSYKLGKTASKDSRLKEVLRVR